MSAEKEIVNYWYNKKGFFTINNIKTNNNKDAGILAFKLDKDKVDEIFHIEVSCSITNNMSETTNLEKSISRIVEEKFDYAKIQALKPAFLQEHKIIKIIVLGAVPKSRKNEIVREFNMRNVQVIEFEDVLYDVLENLDTQYYRNDIIRTLQLIKFLLLGEPTKMAKFLVNESFTSNSRKEFLSNILNDDYIIKEFKKTNVERLGAILKNSGLKPKELAEMLEHSILNKKTRKLFLNSLMEQENIRKLTKPKKVRKLEAPLEKFF